jgi:hypothetical protein
LKSLGAKTNHLPNIQGLAGKPPLPAGVGTKNFKGNRHRRMPSRNEFMLIL